MANVSVKVPGQIKSALLHRHAAASLAGSIASLGLPEISALNGAQLIKPLTWLLRTGDAGGKTAAMRALMFLTDDALCRTVLGRVSNPLQTFGLACRPGNRQAYVTA